MTAKTNDDLEAVRIIADTLEPFAQAERERIVRWARERAGMKGGETAGEISSEPAPAIPTTGVGQDIRSFIEAKQPENDTQLAATVAYYYRFIAPEADRKDSITGDDLIDACRKASRTRPARAGQTLINAKESGFLDKMKEGKGYRINAVGENLVGVVLPGGSPDETRRKSRKKSRPGRVAKRTKSGRAAKKAGRGRA